MKKNLEVKDRKVSLKTLSIAIILVGLLVFSGTYYSLTVRAYSKPLWLDLEIQPQNMKLGVNQSGTWWVLIHNGTRPYTVEWVFDGKVVGSETSVTFTPFLQPSNMTTLMVHVSDSLGNSGFASTTIYDPATINVYLDDLPSQAYFTVKSDGTNYWAVRYDGYKAYEGTVAHTIINNAIAALPARTAKYTIALFGVFSLTGSITPANYLILDCSEANIIYTASVSDGVSMSGKHDINILGGTWTGYTYLKASNLDWVDLKSTCYNVYVRDCVITNFYHGFVADSTCYNLHVESCNFVDRIGDSDGGAGVQFSGAYDSEVLGCRFNIWGNGVLSDVGASTGIKIIGNDFSGWGGGDKNHGVYLDSGGGASHSNVVANNVFHTPIQGTGTGLTIKSYDNVVSGNVFRDLDRWAIQIYSETITMHADYNTIIGNTFEGSTSWAGIAIGGVGGVPMAGNTLHNMVIGNIFSTFTSGTAIYVAGQSTGTYKTRYTKVTNNQFYNGSGGVNIGNAAAEYTEVNDNLFESVTSPITDVGTSSYIHNNNGYKTEAGGIALNKVDGNTIATGLAANIAWLMVAANRTGVIVTATYSATTITLGMRWDNGTTVTQGTSVYWEARSWNYP
jgi:hypothetical protein